ncbi:MAG: family 1 glycosylhydrolase [Actinomycetota bacterium]|nr:family 1 glycosylhydrolase [Actinomycetota bacterium]
MRDFPHDFLFGSSTAAHQVEGGNVNNDWWAWEHGGAAAAGAHCTEPSGDAIDQYHRYRDDIALLAGLGQNAHRMSLEWSRLEPAPGEWSAAAFDHYRRVLGGLADAGLTAFVTLLHFTVPQWIAERGSWLAGDAVERFTRYTEQVAVRLGDLIPYACTINEPQIVAMFGYGTGHHPPGHRDVAALDRVTEVQIAAHRAAVGALRSGSGSPRPGLCLQLPAIEPARSGDEACEELALRTERLMCGEYVEALRSEPATAGDFVGVQYYSRMRMDPTEGSWQAPAPAGTQITQMGWEIYPDGLRQALHHAAGAGLPLVVTENGIATADDAQRVDYLEAHLRAARRAMDEGVDLRGYLYWSSFDNFEWAEGYRPTFGLVGIDRAALRRVVRPSAIAFGRVARTGEISALRRADV